MKEVQIIRRIMAETFEVEASVIKESTNTDNLREWDSMGQVKLVLAIENEFNISIQPKDFILMTDFAGVCRVVDKYLSEATS